MVSARSVGCCHRNRAPASNSRQAPAGSGEPDTGSPGVATPEAPGVAVPDGVAEQPAGTGPPGARESVVSLRREARPCRTTSTPTAETAKLAASSAIALAGPSTAEISPASRGPATAAAD